MCTSVSLTLNCQLAKLSSHVSSRSLDCIMLYQQNSNILGRKAWWDWSCLVFLLLFLFNFNLNKRRKICPLVSLALLFPSTSVAFIICSFKAEIYWHFVLLFCKKNSMKKLFLVHHEQKCELTLLHDIVHNHIIPELAPSDCDHDFDVWLYVAICTTVRSPFVLSKNYMK